MYCNVLFIARPEFVVFVTISSAMLSNRKTHCGETGNISIERIFSKCRDLEETGKFSVGVAKSRKLFGVVISL